MEIGNIIQPFSLQWTHKEHQILLSAHKWLNPSLHPSNVLFEMSRATNTVLPGHSRLCLLKKKKPSAWPGILEQNKTPAHALHDLSSSRLGGLLWRGCSWISNDFCFSLKGVYGDKKTYLCNRSSKRNPPSKFISLLFFFFSSKSESQMGYGNKCGFYVKYYLIVMNILITFRYYGNNVKLHWGWGGGELC